MTYDVLRAVFLSTENEPTEARARYLERLARVVYLRFCTGPRKATQGSVGLELGGVTKARVGQLETRALEILRSPAGRKTLRYLEAYGAFNRCSLLGQVVFKDEPMTVAL